MQFNSIICKISKRRTPEPTQVKVIIAPTQNSSLDPSLSETPTLIIFSDRKIFVARRNSSPLKRTAHEIFN